jgi:citrate synthase
MPGWIANYKEIAEDSKSRIYRPRQVYTGPALNHYVPLNQRKVDAGPPKPVD